SAPGTRALTWPLGSLVRLSLPRTRQDCATSSRSLERSAINVYEDSGVRDQLAQLGKIGHKCLRGFRGSRPAKRLDHNRARRLKQAPGPARAQRLKILRWIDGGGSSFAVRAGIAERALLIDRDRRPVLADLRDGFEQMCVDE